MNVISTDRPGVDDRLAAREEVHSLNWVHSIDLGDGLVTPGQWGPPCPMILRALDAIDFRGKKVLEIGCWDGQWSFEAERRGAAEVYATDYISQRHTREHPTFMLAHRLLKSRAKYFPDVSVYNVHELGIHDFDVVIFCGVYYHLRNPLLALARLRQVLREGGTLLIEGAAIHGPEAAFARYYYRQSLVGDLSNWWLPSISCLREWVESSFFDSVIEFRGPSEVPGFRQRVKAVVKRMLGQMPAEQLVRLAMTAQAVQRKDPKYLYPDDDFRDCDLNQY
jgi:tRNA (mo5U34)-methyltransferase